jgi:hypothetical protein
MARRKTDGIDRPRTTKRKYTMSRAAQRQREEAAKKSTGPRGDARRRTALNGVRHGLDSLAAVLPGESQAEFDRRVALFADGLGAESPLELHYAHEAALASWRLSQAHARTRPGHLGQRAHPRRAAHGQAARRPVDG